MTEKAIQEATQTVLLASTTYGSKCVTIDDWGVLDMGKIAGPFCVISLADSFSVSFLSPSDESTWGVILNVIQPFYNHDDTRRALRDTRAATIAALSTPGNAAVSLVVRRIRNDGGVTPIYQVYGDADIQPDALPDYLYQRIIAECEEF